jgi:HAD superfamily hydrolase (TIGR01459 family)
MRVERLSALADGFDGVLIDQFGVIHDGQTLYPGVLDVLGALASHAVPVAVLTNSGKRAAANRDRLVRMGVPRDCFIDVVSSGEVAWRALTAMTPPPRVWAIGQAGEDYGFEGMTFVADPHDADLILILGSNAPATTLDDYRAQLSGLAIPAVCCNPDMLMLTRHGLLPAPGAIATLYQEMGGQVTWIGKPYPAIYEDAATLIGRPRRVLCIGDSAAHDVAGARAAGHATLLVMTGVSAGLDPVSLDPQPDYWMEWLTW